MRGKEFIFCLLLTIALVMVPDNQLTGQDPGLDSDTFDKRMDRLDSLSKSDLPAALRLGKEIAADAEKAGFREGEIRSYLGIVRIYSIQGKVDSAGTLLDRIYERLDTTEDREYYADYMDLRGNISTMTGKSEEAIGYFRRAYTINKGMGRREPIVRELANIAAVLMHQEQYERALPYIIEAEALSRNSEQWSIYASLLVNHAISLKHMRDTTAAYAKLQEAGQYVDQANIHLKYAYHANMNDFSAFFNQPGEMLEHSKSMLEIAQQMKSDEKEAYAYSGFSKYYKFTGNDRQAEDYLVKAIDLYEKAGEKNRLINIYESASEFYEDWGNYRKAFEYQRKGYDLKQEIQGETTKNRILELETQFDLQRQKSLNLEKELELTQTRTALKTRTSWLYTSLGGLLVTLIIGGLVITNYRRKKQLQDQVMRQKEAEQKVLLLQEHNAGEEKERMRISRELHDNIGGLLAAARLHLSALDGDVADASHLGSPYHKVSEILDKAHREARTISHRLAPIKLEQSGLDGALAYFCNLVSRKDRLNVLYECAGEINAAGPARALVIYRAIQELVVNAIKHAECSEILVQVFRHGDDCEVIVEDNGRGIDLDAREPNGIGLKNIENQVALLDGRMRIDHAEEGGTSIELFCPEFFKTKE